MHISAVCLPILSGAYRGCMQTPNQPSFSFSSFCLSHIRPSDAPVLHHYSALQNMEEKKENRDTHTRLCLMKKHLQKHLLYRSFCFAVGVFCETHTIIINFDWREKVCRVRVLEKARYGSIAVQYAQI